MKKIIHCDADCFFVALETRDDMDLQGIPVAVGGDPARRGVIATCNYEARAFGVHSAMASAYAKRLCPQMIILPPRFEKYRQASQMMRDIFLDYSDCIEPLSLDEAFLEVTRTHHCLGSATLIAKNIRRRVEKQIGITISAGVAPNKFLAKVASDWQKPGGLTVIEPTQIRFFLKNLRVERIPGVGPSLLNKLHGKSIFTCSDLQTIEEAVLISWFGKFGSRLYQLSRGEDTHPVKAREFRKSMSVEHTFSQDIPDLAYCLQYLDILAAKIRQRLKVGDQPWTINKCFIKLKFADFSLVTMEAATQNLCMSLYRQLLTKTWKRHRKSIRLLGLGIRFSEPEASPAQQIPLF